MLWSGPQDLLFSDKMVFPEMLDMYFVKFDAFSQYLGARLAVGGNKYSRLAVSA
jgi:hypothetical protein